ncbi:MAG TPA: hypothetical protein VK840_04315 [Candidatus Dormibacteraeota bacterium]|nr:hypothetical protein [Candidatus Dormibacteraeota bacterium]
MSKERWTKTFPGNKVETMNTSKRKLIGFGILVATVLAAAAFQIFGHGLVVVTELHPNTPSELAAKGVDMAGGQHVDLSRVVVLAIIGITGLIIALVPNRVEKHMA